MEIFEAIYTSRTCMTMCKFAIVGQYDDAAYCLDAPENIVIGSTIPVPTSTNDEGVFASPRYTTRPGWEPSRRISE
jgi:hypothetical protein